jgi:hypothetical protein
MQHSKGFSSTTKESDARLVDSIIALVKKNDYSVQKRALLAGDAAYGPLVQFIRSDSTARRQLALYSIEACCPEKAASIAQEFLTSTDIQTLSAAIQLLKRRPDQKAFHALLDGLEKQKDRDAREEIAWIIVLLPEKIETSQLKIMLKKEKIPQVSNAIRVALARHGDPDSREWFRWRFNAAPPQMVKQWITYCSMIKQPWCASLLIPLLDDTVTIEETVFEGLPEASFKLRVCDIAAAALAEIARNRKTQLTDRSIPDAKRIWTDKQLSEIKEIGMILSKMPSE